MTEVECRDKKRAPLRFL